MNDNPAESRRRAPLRGKMAYAPERLCGKQTVLGTPCEAPVGDDGHCWARSQHAD